MTLVHETIELLERLPRLGAEPPDDQLAAAGLRFFNVKKFRNYLIAYFPLLNGVDVVRVIDGRRELGDLFDDF